MLIFSPVCSKVSLTQDGAFIVAKQDIADVGLKFRLNERSST